MHTHEGASLRPLTSPVPPAQPLTPSRPGGWAGAASQLRGIFVTIRPKHWLKNVLVFAPLIFAQELFVGEQIARSIGAFLLFCGLASGVYLFNDLADLKADRMHPRKRLRPLPSGGLSPALAAAACVFLLAVSLGGAVLLDRRVALGGGAYVLVNLAYSLALKHVVLLDVFVLSSGFVLRAWVGGVAIGVLISPWLFLCTLFLSLFLALGKRRHELVSVAQPHEHRPSLAHYSTLFIDQMVGILAAITVATYALYTVADPTVERFGTENLIYTVPFVLYGIFRYMYLIYQRDGGDRPEHALLTDGPILVTVVLWGLAVVGIIYWR